jgi:hypothetical protein
MTIEKRISKLEKTIYVEKEKKIALALAATNDFFICSDENVTTRAEYDAYVEKIKQMKEQGYYDSLIIYDHVKDGSKDQQGEVTNSPLSATDGSVKAQGLEQPKKEIKNTTSMQIEKQYSAHALSSPEEKKAIMARVQNKNGSGFDDMGLRCYSWQVTYHE